MDLTSILGIVDAAKPNVVITAPDGSQLWTRVTMPDSSGDSEPSSLFSGYKIKLTVGDPPQSPTVTTSAPTFATAQAGKVFVAWLTTPAGLITAGAVVGIGVALLSIRRRK